MEKFMGNRFTTTSLDFSDVLLIPQKCIVNSRKDVNLSTVISHNKQSNILLGTPLISANMDTVTDVRMASAMSSLGCGGFLHRYKEAEKVVKDIIWMKTHNFHPIIPSVGCSKDTYWDSIVEWYISSGADGVCIDIAHGHSDKMINMLQRLSAALPEAHIIAGNIATAQAAAELILAGATGLKVGVGPGSVCTTRLETGAGVPQFTAIYHVAEVANEHNIPVIADGGMRSAGDIVKALAAGASAIMSGSLFSGADETPGLGKYRGMASKDAKKDWDGNVSNIEGKTIQVENKGPVRDIVEHLLDGIRSGISYCGADSVQSMWKSAEFIITK
jgi:IMP dehydrogenase